MLANSQHDSQYLQKQPEYHHVLHIPLQKITYNFLCEWRWAQYPAVFVGHQATLFVAAAVLFLLSLGSNLGPHKCKARALHLSVLAHEYFIY